MQINHPDTLRSVIRDCEVDLRVGVCAHEKIRPQRVIVNVEIEAVAAHAFNDREDADLANVINYATIRDFICLELPKQEHTPLLETVAERIIRFCFDDPQVVKVSARLEKPRIFPETESVGIELVRVRKTPSRNGYVLVTGAAKRIGRVIALNLARAGYDIAAHFNTSKTEAESLADEIREIGRKACLIQADLADAEAVERLIPAVNSEVGIVKALVNNASLFERDEDDADGSRHMQINRDAPCRLIEMFAAQLPDDGGGAVVNVLDSGGTHPHFTAYDASKQALHDATLELAYELAPRVRVNGVALGYVIPNPRESQAHFDGMVAESLLRTAATPENVADTVRFLIENPAITGEVINTSAKIA